MRLALIVFVCAVLVHVAWRIRRPSSLLGPSNALPTHAIRMILACPVGFPWRDAVMQMLTHARWPRAIRVYVLLECTDTRDLDTDDGSLSDHLKSLVHVEHAHSCGHGVIGRVLRTVRRFVRSTSYEGVVVSVDCRARLVRGWDAVVMNVLHDDDPSTLLMMSAPSTSTTGTPRFPTLSEATGSESVGAARGAAREFANMHAAVPSGCWCAEFSACRTHVWRDALKKMKWHDRSSAAQSREMAQLGCVHVVPAVPVVEHDASEFGLVTDDVGDGRAKPTKRERVGLTDAGDSLEQICKFGSVRKTRLLLKLAPQQAPYS